MDFLYYIERNEKNRELNRITGIGTSQPDEKDE